MPPTGQFTEQDVEASWSQLEHEVLPRLKVEEPAWAEDPESARHRGDPRDRELLVQHLTDLGYLLGDVSDAHPDHAVRAAVAQWRTDDRRFPAVVLRSNTFHTAREFLRPGEMARLAAQAGVERELELRAPPDIGERSLLSRIVRFRLRLFNLSEVPASAPFDEEARSRLDELAELLRVKDESPNRARLGVVELLGNVAELCRVFMRHWGQWVFVFRHDPTAPERSVAGELRTLADSNAAFARLYQPNTNDYRRLFISCGRHRHKNTRGAKGARIENMFGEDGFRYYASDDPLKWIRAEIERTPPVEEAEGHLINRLGLELLQLRLWLIGYYEGRLDGAWGPLSFAALRRFLVDEEADVEKLVFPLAEGYLALNLRYLFKRILPKVEEAAANVEYGQVREVEDELHRQMNDPAEQAAVQRSYRDMEHDDRVLHAGSSGRRRPGGLPGLFTALGRFFKRVLGSIVKLARAVLRGIKELAASALQLFRHVIHRIRKGLRVVGLAVKRFYYWLARKPFVTGRSADGRFVLTRFDWDGDAFHFASDEIRAGEIRGHHRALKRMNLAFVIVSRLAIKAVDLISSAAIGNWLMLAWDLMRLLTSNFWKELKALIREYRETFDSLEGPVVLYPA